MPKLYEDDQAKVNEVLNEGANKKDRVPFRPWLLLMIIFIALVALTLVSYYIAAQEGFV